MKIFNARAFGAALALLLIGSGLVGLVNATPTEDSTAISAKVGTYISITAPSDVTNWNIDPLKSDNKKGPNGVALVLTSNSKDWMVTAEDTKGASDKNKGHMMAKVEEGNLVPMTNQLFVICENSEYNPRYEGGNVDLSNGDSTLLRGLKNVNNINIPTVFQQAGSLDDRTGLLDDSETPVEYSITVKFVANPGI